MVPGSGVDRTILSPLCFLSACVDNALTTNVPVDFWTLGVIPLMYAPAVYRCRTVWVPVAWESLSKGKIRVLQIFFYFKIVSAILLMI